MRKNMGILYLVPTPIGNLKDITYRAVEILQSCQLIAAEDTRTSRRLLQEYQIDCELISYHKFNERARVEKILSRLAANDDVAIISDAGTPGISDPSKIIVQAAIKANFRVEALPGATAFVPALVASGLDSESFTFIGFLPEKLSDRMQLLQELKLQKFPTIFYESPHRIEKFLKLFYEHWGERQVVLAREISKLYETYYRGKLSYFLQNPSEIKNKGEFVIIVDGAKAKSWQDDELLEQLRQLINDGYSPKLAIKQVSQSTQTNKNHVYQLALQLKSEQNC
ncbi:MAG: 16S rRNA (cytidine(1402)-2'-O)-methyltransferase [Candidatus Cloacimonadales bacterium]